jgi:hypothetical protein
LTTAQAAQIFLSKYVQGAPLSTNYGDSAFDLRHRFTSTLIYELPFGHGKMFATNAGSLLEKMIGGWEASTVFEFQTGNTSPLSDGQDANRDGVTNDRPILTGPLSALFVDGNGGVVKTNTGTDEVVRGLAACGTDCTNLGLNLGLGVIDPGARMARGSVRAPHLWTDDIALDKRFKLTERFGLQFRTEAFNVFNHTNFVRPSRTVGSPSSFGLITSQRSINSTLSRELQFGLKLEF